MMTTEKFKQLAKACKTSDEFAERAAELDKGGIYRQMFRKFKHEDKWEAHKKVIEALCKRVDCQNLWYEVWIDLEEGWDKMWGILKEMEFDERVEKCAAYLNERERFYGSSDYTDMLDAMLATVKD